MTPSMATQRRAVLDRLGLGSGERVLDVGVGNGLFARELAAAVGPSGEVNGIDTAEAMLAMARATCPEGRFFKGDATALPMSDANFDAVTASQLLCFVPDVDAALAEMFRVLKPGGRAVLLDTDWGSLVWNTRDADLMAKAVKLLISPYADPHLPRTLSRRLAAAGFTVTDRHSFPIVDWDRGPHSHVRQTIAFLERLAADAAWFTAEDWQAWTADQDAIVAAGDYLFSVNRYVFTATKPRFQADGVRAE